MKRSPYFANRVSWNYYLRTVQRNRSPDLGPFEWIISHRPFIRAMMIGVTMRRDGRLDSIEILPPILTPKPPEPMTGWERRMMNRRSAIKHRDPRFCPEIRDQIDW